MADLVIKKIDTRVHVLACPQGNIFAELSNAWMIAPRSWQQHNDTIVNPSFSLVSFNFTDRWYPPIWGSDTLPCSNLSLPSFKVLSEMACRVDEFNFGFNIAPTNLRYLITDKKSSFAHFVYGYLFCYALFFFLFFFFSHFAFRSGSSPVHLKWSFCRHEDDVITWQRMSVFIFIVQAAHINILKHN